MGEATRWYMKSVCSAQDTLYNLAVYPESDMVLVMLAVAATTAKAVVVMVIAYGIACVMIFLIIVHGCDCACGRIAGQWWRS